MSQATSLKIDIFSHIIPPKFKKALDEAAPGHTQQAANNTIPTLFDMDKRFRLMEKFGVVQVLTLSRPPLEEVFVSNPKKGFELIKMANDEIAELVLKYPDRFPAGVASVALNYIEPSLKELERCINDLKFRGVQIYSHVNDKPLSSPEFMPLFEMMAKFNLPIWIHPTTGATAIDYRTEKESLYNASGTFGWPYDTTLAMYRLTFAGVLEKWPNLKFIAHHGGALIPYFAERITAFTDHAEMSRGARDKVGLTKRPIEYLKMFYADTALYGNTPALMLARAFYGADHLLFGTDFPFAGHNGERVTRQTIDAIEEMDITKADRQKIYEGNARSIMRLPI
jgi:predicted TIM-barrel fold metal-dependent hydrolase